MKLDFLKKYEFFTGVPDSLLKPLCSYLMETYGVSKNHVIAANEGNAAALAAGYHLATGKTPVVYLQNSGIGNIINPLASLMNDKVYGIPCLFIIGWRGEPGVHDEPQHIFQGEVTVRLMEDMDVATLIVTKETTEEELNGFLLKAEDLFGKGKQAALIVKKGALEYESKIKYENGNVMSREDIIKHITDITGDDIIISTTGKASRELFEIREAKKETHGKDFLTVGSMGHSSSIALGIALRQPERKIWIIDGDGAALMHLGSMALLGANTPENVVHIVINNQSHETVGGLPTVGGKIRFTDIALDCGYKSAVKATDFITLDNALTEAKHKKGLCFIEAMSSIGARADLGRPTTTAKENKEAFMDYIKE